MRGKSLALLVLALGCGLVASLGITQVMARRSGDPAVVSGETQSVVVVVKETGGGELLSAAALKLEQWPKDRAPAGSLSRIEDAEGRRTRTRVYVGEPIYENKIFPKGAGGDADGLIPKGYRVVAVNVDARSAIGYLLRPGSRVDIQVHVTRGGNIPETTTRTILQNIKVFAVNDVVSLDTAGQETKNIQARTVSLLVTPAQAERVTLASEMGNIRLVLRPIDDESEVDTGGDTVSSIFGKPLSGNRKEEEKGNPPAGESKDGGFLALLEQMRNKKAAEQTPAPPKDPAHHCVMRVLAGPNVQIFDLESDGPGDALADAGFWKVSGQKAALPGSDKDLPEVKRPAASLAPAPAETPKPPQDEKAKDKKPKDAKSL